MKKFLCFAILLLVAVNVFAQTGKWSGTIKVGQAPLLLVFDLTEGEEATLDIPDQHAYGINVKVSRNDFGRIGFTIQSLAASYDGIMMGNMIVGSFCQMGYELPLTLKPGVPELKRPQTPVGPFPYQTEEVSFNNGDAVLKGTLTLPEGCDRKTPVLLMVTGSGLQNRDEEIFEHKPFAVIADALARNGIATLRYDDRGFGESTGDLVNVTTDDFKNDALAGVALLRERFDNVGVLGHSEGGSYALLLAADSRVDFVVSLAGMVVSTRETLLKQNRDVLWNAGFTETQISEYLKLLDAAFDAVITGITLPSANDYDLPAVLKDNYVAALGQLNTPYMKSSLAMDPRTILGAIKCPVLALNGTKDTQVDCQENIGALEAGIKADLPGFRIERVSGVNHLFQHCQTGEISEYKTIEETISPEVLKIIADWVKNL